LHIAPKIICWRLVGETERQLTARAATQRALTTWQTRFSWRISERSLETAERLRSALPHLAKIRWSALGSQQDAACDFRGAMAGRGDKGLLITTGTFTSEAKAEATRDGAPPVDLIDGHRLCYLLKEYELGVRRLSVRSRTSL